MKLLFDHDKKSIVMSINNRYYDMRNGELCSEPARFSLLKMTNKEYRTKWKPIGKGFLHYIPCIPIFTNNNPTGYNLNFGNIVIKVELDDQGNYQLVGNVPLYCLKSLDKLLWRRL